MILTWNDDPEIFKRAEQVQEMGLYCPTSLKMWGRFSIDNKNYAAAIDPLLKLYEIAPHDYNVDYYLAWCYYQLKNIE